MTEARYSEFIPKKPGHYVYRLWAADGTCLYVGCAGEIGPKRVNNRLAQHKRSKPWWPQVARIDVAGLTGTQEVVAEERAQIAQLRPIHNKSLVPRCVNGHDTSDPSARYESGACRKCQHESNAGRDKRREREYRQKPEVKAKYAANSRRYRLRRSGPAVGQSPLW